MDWDGGAHGHRERQREGQRHRLGEAARGTAEGQVDRRIDGL